MDSNSNATMEEQSLITPSTAPVPIFAWDLSGSTSHMAYYHAVGAKYLEKFLTAYKDSPSTNPAPIFLTWEDNANQVSLEALKDIIARRYGSGGNTTSCIITWIEKNLGTTTPIDLWLVTDGELTQYDLQNCSHLNASLKMNYATLNFIIISQSQRINMSVGAAFFSGSKVKIFMNEQFLKEINTSEPFDYGKVTIVNFTQTVSELSDYIQAKFMGSEIQGLEEADKLNALRARLFAEIDKQDENAKKKKGEGDNTNIDWKDKAAMMDWFKGTKYYKNLTDEGVKDFRTTVDSAISTLVNYIHNTHKTCQFFDILKQGYKEDKVGFVTTVQPDLDLDLESLEDWPEKISFFDAVTLEVEQDSLPVLLLHITDLIDKYWVNGNYTKFRRVAECPLFGQFDESVGHVFGMDTVKQLFHNSSSQFRNPMTNKASYGGIIPHASFDTWNDYLLMITFFRGKKIRTCPALFYYQIWKTASTSEWIEPGVASLLEQYALRRIASAKCRLAFGSMPMDPTEVVPLPVTIFYCGEGSTHLFAQNPALFLNERLRQFFPIVGDFLDIMTKLEIPYDSTFIKERATAFRVLSMLKTAGNEMDQKYALISNVFRKAGKFVTYEVEENQDSTSTFNIPVKFLVLLNYTHKSQIPFLLPPVNLNDYVHITYDSNFPEVPLLKETLRPRFALEGGEESGKIIPNYKQILEYVSEVVLEPETGKRVVVDSSAVKKLTKLDQTKLLSLRKAYINFTTSNKRYPTNVEEFEEFVWKTNHFSGNKIRLFPPSVRDMIQETFTEYKKIEKQVTLNEFIERGSAGVRIVKRLELENVMKENLEKFVDECRKEWLA